MNQPVGVHWLLVGFILAGLANASLSSLKSLSITGDNTFFLLIFLTLLGLALSPFAFVGIMRLIREYQEGKRRPRSRVR